MSTTQGIKLDDETSARLKALGEVRNRSPHWLMRTAIDDYLKREEQYEQEKAEDLAEYESYLTSGKAIDNATVTAWLSELVNGKKAAWPKQK
jgi:predicted transcriptional regulator